MTGASASARKAITFPIHLQVVHAAFDMRRNQNANLITRERRSVLGLHQPLKLRVWFLQQTPEVVVYVE